MYAIATVGMQVMLAGGALAVWSEAEAAYACAAAAVSAGQALDLAAVLREAIAAEVQA